ncbi:MAG: signal peptidase I [Deltaproteobacteria bacterium]|nr:signal peptidase I [Deltaproteobacteria bacterium]
MQENNYIGRKGWVAAVAGMSMPGMGQVYNGELVKGLSFLTIYIMTFVTGMGLTVYLPDKYLMFGVFSTVAVVLTFYAVSILEAYRKSLKIGSGYSPKPYNKWYIYVALWMVGSLLVTGFAYSHTRENVIQLFKIPAEGMQPEIMKGDKVIADKTAYRRMPPRKGDIVIFVYPDDRSKFFIRRIAGLPGDVVRPAGGREYAVPHGMVFVLGDSLDKSIDSRIFGPVALSDMIAKVRQVYFSSGPDGIRWNRIGLTLNKF